MALEEKINGDLKAAMMAKDQGAMRALRGIKAAILLAKTEKGGTGEVSEEKEIQILTKMLKQRKESIEIFEKQGRADLATTEKEEVAVLEKYMPSMMSDEDIKAIIQKVIAATGATTQKEMGKVMGAASKELAGKADNKKVSEIVKSLLV
ncbi:MAG: GatB/YqeY protein [Bacteroidetes bacterium]|nr:GatB/YqeY protein [Bacteroidota bacterium]